LWGVGSRSSRLQHQKEDKKLTLKFHDAAGNGNNEGVKSINAHMYKQRFSFEALA